jgi:hypothetical protein
MNTILKSTIISACKKVLEDKLQFLKSTLEEATDAGNNETKSTAGDKHETGRAMMQLEQEKLGQQLLEIENQLLDFDKIDFTIQSKTIINGSFIETNKGCFLIASAIGKIEVEDKVVYVISSKSPLALTLLGLKEKEDVDFNRINYEIKTIL